MFKPIRRWRKPGQPFRRKPYGKSIPSGQSTKRIGSELTTHLPFASLILYVVVSVASTTDVILLRGEQGFRLPVVGIDISLVGFYIVAPIIILIAHLVTTKKVSEASQTFLQYSAKNAGSLLDTLTENILLTLLMFAGPGAILFTMMRFASYQHRSVFFLHTTILLLSILVSCIRHNEFVLAYRAKTSRIGKSVGWMFGAIILAYWAVCFDVMFVPPQHSITLLLKTETTLLDDQDGGTIALIPHIKIDRAIKLWNGDASKGFEDPHLIGDGDKESAFMNHEIVLDLRNRRLRFLDLHFQIVPRIWAHEADLSGANLSFSKLYGTQFVDTQLFGVNFNLAALDGATFMNSKVVRSTFINSRLRGTYWDNSKIEQTLMEGSDLFLSSFFGTIFKESEIIDSTLTAISVDGLDTFKGANLNLNKNSQAPPIFKPMDDSNEIEKRLFSFNTQKVANSIIEVVCKSPSDIGSRYAWNTFSQLEVLRSRRWDDERRDVLKKVFSSGSCRSLQDKGLRGMLVFSGE